MTEGKRGLPESGDQVWRMERSRLRIQTLIVVGLWAGGGVWCMLQGAFELVVLGVLIVIVGLIWAWFQLWLPKAVLTASELRVRNRLRTHRIALEDIVGTVKRAALVTFILSDGRRIPVSAINGWYVGQKWFPAMATHREAFLRAVFEAKNLKERPRAAGED